MKKNNEKSKRIRDLIHGNESENDLYNGFLG